MPHRDKPPRRLQFAARSPTGALAGSPCVPLFRGDADGVPAGAERDDPRDRKGAWARSLAPMHPLRLAGREGTAARRSEGREHRFAGDPISKSGSQCPPAPPAEDAQALSYSPLHLSRDPREDSKSPRNAPPRPIRGAAPDIASAYPASRAGDRAGPQPSHPPRWPVP
jgi:hypothetical protein